MNEIEDRVELAAIDLLYARAELLTIADPQALSRALNLIDDALSRLMPQTHRHPGARAA